MQRKRSTNSMPAKAATWWLIYRGGQKCGGHCQDGPQNNQPVPLLWKPINKNANQILDDTPMLEQEGLQIRMQQGATLLDYVKLYLTDQIIENIVTETNRYAECFLASVKKNVTTHFAVGGNQ